MLLGTYDALKGEVYSFFEAYYQRILISSGDSSEDGRSLSLFTPEDLKRAEESGEFDVDANILDLRPDPAHFAAFLRSLDRPDMASEIFVRVLAAYRESEVASDADPLK